jgi:hypothetical protein
MAAGVGAPGIAAAEEAPPVEDGTSVDVVRLRDGTVFRGRVTEILAGTHVTIVDGSGETRRIPWSDLERVVVSSTPAPAPPPPPPPPMTGPLVRVHIDGPSDVVLFRRPPGASEWVSACTAPCDQELPLHDAYRVTVKGSIVREISLHPDAAGKVDIVVTPPSTLGKVGGITMMAAGAAAATIGFGSVALIGNCGAGDCGSGPRQSTTGPWAVTLGGGAVALVGLLVFLRSAHTDVVQGHEEESHPSAPPARFDAFLRTPTSRTASPIERAAPSATIPLVFERSF